jgi:hypothetical protein
VFVRLCVRELCDCPCDGVVQAAVEAAEIVCADRGVPLDGEFGDGLAAVAVFVDDLGNSEAVREEIVAVLKGGCVMATVRAGVSRRSSSTSWSRNMGTPWSSEHLSGLRQGGRGPSPGSAR